MVGEQDEERYEGAQRDWFHLLQPLFPVMRGRITVIERSLDSDVYGAQV